MSDKKKKYEPKPNTGAAFKNKNKSEEKHPDYTGSYVHADGTQWWFSAWIHESEEGKYFSFVTKPKEPKEL